MRKLSVVFAAAAMFVASSSSAAPVVTDLQLSILIQGLDSVNLTIPSVTVSVSGSTVSVPAAGLTGLGIVVPVTATTSIAQISANTIGIAGGTFTAGGVTNQAPGEVCVAGTGQACNSGGGIGGVMGLTGVVNVAVIPNVVVIPVNLNAALVGQGGSTNTPFTFDAAAWSTGAGSVNTGASVITTAGAASPLTLVTPTFVSALGNLLPLFTSLTLTNVSIVPEPGTLLLLGAGAAGLIVVGRRRK